MVQFNSVFVLVLHSFLCSDRSFFLEGSLTKKDGFLSYPTHLIFIEEIKKKKTLIFVSTEKNVGKLKKLFVISDVEKEVFYFL